MSIIGLQRRLRELGRIRLGDKDGKGYPQKLNYFRLTSPSRHLLEEAAGLWGGEVREWTGSPAEGAYELYTQTDRLPIAIPPGGEPLSQWMEQWTAGGCTHRCDTERNHITDAPCSCNPEKPDCKITTRVNLVLPDLPDVGVWRLESHGYNAAVELPGTIDLIRMAQDAGQYLTGTLRIEHRTSKQDGKTRRFITPCIDLDVTIGALMAGEDPRPSSLAQGQESRTLLPSAAGVEDQGDTASSSSGAAPPVEPGASFTPDAPPAATGGPVPGPGQVARGSGAASPSPMSESQRRRLFVAAKEKGVERDTVRQIARMVLGHGLSEAGADEFERMETAIERYAKGGQKAADTLAQWIAAQDAPEPRWRGDVDDETRKEDDGDAQGVLA